MNEFLSTTNGIKIGSIVISKNEKGLWPTRFCVDNIKLDGNLYGRKLRKNGKLSAKSGLIGNACDFIPY